MSGHQPTGDNPSNPPNKGPTGKKPAAGLGRVRSLAPFPDMSKIDGYRSLAVILEVRGVQWPLGGYAPGNYMAGKCSRCDELLIEVDKRARTCLPCALVQTIEINRAHAEDRDLARKEGIQNAVATMRRHLDMLDQPPMRDQEGGEAA